MAVEQLKRSTYFDPPTEFPHSSRNHAEDFAAFHLPLARMHHATLHDWGIARGLEVRGARGAAAVTVEPGVAIDRQGQLIALARGGTGDIGADPPAGAHTEVPVPVQLSTARHAGQTVYVTIQFAEIRRVAEGSGGRLEQVPWLRLQSTAVAVPDIENGTAIVLAIAEIDQNGNVAELRAQDEALPHRRRLLGQLLEEVRIRRSDKVGDRVEEVPAGTIGPGTGGGLRITVPERDAAILVAHEDGGHFGSLAVRADTIPLDGDLHVAGNVGIGTTQPSNKLDVNHPLGIRQNQLFLSGDDGWSSLSYNAHHNAENNGWEFLDRTRPAVTIEMDDARGGRPRFEVWSTRPGAQPSWIQRLRIEGDSGNVFLAHNGGNVGIGTTTPGFTLDVAGPAHASSFPTSSDARLKTNVKPLTNVLEKLEQIRGVSFEWNDVYASLGRSTGQIEIGVIGQEVEAVFPELVTTWGDDRYRAVDYGRLTGILIEAVKALRAENKVLAQRLQALEQT